MIRIGIFMGGASLEKEVSFNSGRTIYDYIEKERYYPVPIFITQNQKMYLLPWQFLYRGKISDFEERLESEATHIPWNQLSEYIDFAFLALHGKYGEDGSIQGLLEILQIPYSGSSILANAITTNKIFLNKLLHYRGIAIPESIVIKKNQNYNETEIKKFIDQKKKIIIKPAHEGSSLGVSIARNISEFETGFSYAKSINQESQDVLVQEFIEGKEFSIIAQEDESGWTIFEPTEIEYHRDFFTYEEKYLPGAISKYTPARFEHEIIKKMKDLIYQIIEIVEPEGFIRIDGIIQKETNILYIIDTNPFPGTAPNSFTFIQAAHAGITPRKFVNDLIKRNLEKKGISDKETKEKITNREKIKIAIILGGNSNEKEISLESGRNVFSKLPDHLYEKTVLFLASNKKFYRLSTSNIVKDTTKEIESCLDQKDYILCDNLKNAFDFVFIALHGGEGEDGTLQKQLEQDQIPFNGSNSIASKIGMNKNKTLDILANHGISTTKRLLIKKDESEKEIAEKIEKIFTQKTACIIKPNDDGCSALVFFAPTKDDILPLTKSIFKSKQECLIEEYIDDRELTVGVIGNKTESISLPITEAKKEKNLLSLEEKFLPGAGENITPADFTPDETALIKETIKKAYDAIGCDGYARIDCFWRSEKKELTILECNTLPALTPATCFFHQTAELDINPTDTLEYIIYLGLEKHSKDTSLIEFMKARTAKTKQKLES
jgi:D-alanine--D-alanine ligase